jgi:hypothetical protein
VKRCKSLVARFILFGGFARHSQQNYSRSCVVAWTVEGWLPQFCAVKQQPAFVKGIKICWNTYIHIYAVFLMISGCCNIFVLA